MPTVKSSRLDIVRYAERPQRALTAINGLRNIDNVKRQLTASERELIAARRPWFGLARQEAAADLAANEAEIIEFSVRRFWDVNECGPPCCPREILVETTASQFIHLESWTVLPEATALGTECAAHRAMVSKTLLNFDTTGSAVGVEQKRVREALLDFDAPECDWVDLTDLPVAFRQSVGVSGESDANAR